MCSGHQKVTFQISQLYEVKDSTFKSLMHEAKRMHSMTQMNNSVLQMQDNVVGPNTRYRPSARPASMMDAQTIDPGRGANNVKLLQTSMFQDLRPRSSHKFPDPSTF